MSARPVSTAPRAIAAILAAALATAPFPARAGGIALEEGPNEAATPAPSDLRITADQPTRKLTLGIGRSSIVELPADAAEVFVGNPQVANAVVRSARRMFVIGVADGQTTIFALDKTGRRIATLNLVINSRDIGDLSAILRTAMPGTDIHVQAVNDTIILTGSVDSALEAQKAYDIANAYVGYTAVGGGGAANSGSGSSISFGSTQVVSGNLINSLVIRDRDQVMLKVQVVEVQRSVLKQLGINLTGNWASRQSVSTRNEPSIGQVLDSSIAASVASGGISPAFSGTVDALERNGVAHVLAEPTVTAISGESANFTAGGQVPIATSSTYNANSTTGQVCTVTTTLQPYGVNLNFTPTVLSSGRISLHLATEVSDVDSNDAIAYACSNTSGLRVRKNETTVELPSGGSIVTAGLIQQTSRQAIRGVPGLMNLPVLGALFRSRDYQRDESELMIVVTPYIARPLRPEEVSRPDDGFQDAADPQSWFLGSVNRIYSTAATPNLTRTYKGKVGFIND